jgi:hypothetical protein
MTAFSRVPPPRGPGAVRSTPMLSGCVVCGRLLPRAGWVAALGWVAVWSDLPTLARPGFPLGGLRNGRRW